MKIQGKNTGGFTKDLLHVSTGNQAVVGGGGIPLLLTSSQYINTNGADITLDSNTGNIYFKKDNITNITFDTDAGNISMSGNLIATGSISSSGTVTGLSGSFDHLNMNGIINMNGNTVTAGSLTTTGIASIGSDLTVYGNTTLGNANTDEIAITGVFQNPLTSSEAISSSAGLIANTLQIDGSQVDFTNLPTSDPGVAGRLYNDSGTVKISL